MLQIQQISKWYRTGDLVQAALDNVSLNLRDNEFVAILGPSGSGKTTLLNIIGGLDRYDRGDLVINGVSTQRYTDRDWDSYRNHTIGFVFQSYHLIPHQSVLSNVELALTISGISKAERRKRATEALERVGLGEHLHKRPNQMSGGQMQRVAIARALVNNPDILLADEPTGALDTETSISVMELLKEVAKDRLVVMVTHNPELAESYATRIVRLKDGKITSDTDPYEMKEAAQTAPSHQNLGKASMSFGTALSLSFNNLRTKKGRTILTSFAGSIGIIGIALILALSTGVNSYIKNIQRDTMSSYPITIQSQEMSMGSMMTMASMDFSGEEHEKDAVYPSNAELEVTATLESSIVENNLEEFKKYLDNKDSEIYDYVGEAGIVYQYGLLFDVFTYDSNDTLINTNGSDFAEAEAEEMMQDSNGMTVTTGLGMNVFTELLPGQGDALVGTLVTENYELVYGEWPESSHDMVLVMNENSEVSTTTLYQLGLLPAKDYKEIVEAISRNESPSMEGLQWDYEDICNQTYYLIPACEYYKENGDGTFASVSNVESEIRALTEQAIELRISAVICPKEDAENANIAAPIGYVHALNEEIIARTEESAVVKAQRNAPGVNVLTGVEFDEAEADDLSIFGMGSISGSLEDNLAMFGAVDENVPQSIYIYADTFEDKDSVISCIEHYNEIKEKEDQIIYTDYVGLLISSVTTIVDVISYVLIAFVAVSLLVSSIMIGIITYISVLERTKEIGILRAIGASKRNISQVFNAETFIIGLFAGLIGVGLTLFFLLPCNAIIHAAIGSNAVNASLPFVDAVILILLSMGLTLIGGLIPSSKAAKKDPVAALRTE